MAPRNPAVSRACRRARSDRHTRRQASVGGASLNAAMASRRGRRFAGRRRAKSCAGGERAKLPVVAGGGRPAADVLAPGNEPPRRDALAPTLGKCSPGMRPTPVSTVTPMARAWGCGCRMPSGRRGQPPARVAAHSPADVGQRDVVGQLVRVAAAVPAPHLAVVVGEQDSRAVAGHVDVDRHVLALDRER